MKGKILPHYDDDSHLTPNAAAASATLDVAKTIGAASVRLRRALDRTDRGSLIEDMIRHDVARVDAAWSALTPSMNIPLPVARAATRPAIRLAIAAGSEKSAAELLFQMFELLTNPMVQEQPGTDDLTVSIHFRKKEYEKTCNEMADVLRANGYAVT